jgi:O-acetyl-ADP-ribose deacetylase (regulator of RNase III)
MKIYLADIKPQLRIAWKNAFRGVENVQVYERGIGSILDLEVDALVSPANSFGFMDGGIDELYSETLGWHVSERLQDHIVKDFNGELLIGQATIVPTDHAVFKYLIAAPTMRVPTRLPDNTVNVFLATRAALFLADKMAKRGLLTSVAFPGLGTGIGAVSPEKCALQMRAAYDWVFNNERPEMEWKKVLDHHTYLYTGLRATNTWEMSDNDPDPELGWEDELEQ